ncbi:hypothetical protein [Hymenobacter sp. CRA2]|uniref:hypothetical protein n=1 Tax=Hymenobacter sp. CRA2 TaxID=1955620 RepID=UPI00098F49BD|nr:hypothetical protein [Hymenobacter sp. CRA2]OON68534.1 hypothetical protein B0919_12895 [Hymenobacter sp. CRA2]
MSALLLAGCQGQTSEPDAGVPAAAPPPAAAPADTAVVNRTVRNFYAWYGKAISSEGPQTEFQPDFVADAQGRLTLDYRRYFANLRRLHFAESLIRREMATYQPCIDTLRAIPYAQRDSLLDDVDDYEQRDCAFFDSYRWTRSQDRFTGIRLQQTRIMGDSAAVQVQLFEYYPDNEAASRYYFWETPYTVRLTRAAGAWLISDIDFSDKR